MLNLIGRKRRILLFSQRPSIRRLNYLIDKATYDIDVALVEELMEEKARFIQSITSNK